MRLVGVLFTFKNNTGRTDGPTDRRTDGPTDTTSYRDATAHLKTGKNGNSNWDIHVVMNWSISDVSYCPLRLVVLVSM